MPDIDSEKTRAALCDGQEADGSGVPRCPHLAEWMDAATWAPLCKACGVGCPTCGFDFASLGLSECTVCKAAKRLSGADDG